MTADLKQKLKLYRLSADEYELINQKLGRAPQGVEWALFSALWSEHCSYKSSRVHLKKLFKTSSRVLQSFGENAGVVDLGEGEKIAFKMESHNHPSYIEPYQGAATGVGGILRDIFTMGARPIALADYLCFGEPQAPRVKALVSGVVGGIGGYGNCVGVPTITGQTEFHSSYNKNNLVNAMAVGLFGPDDPIVLSKARQPGALVVYAGAKTGRDGVHGASMASESFEKDSSAKRPTVQIGDPFYEKLLIEACLEVMQKDLVLAIQDMGAAGLTSSSFEMAAKGGVGFDIFLHQVPLRDQTMSPEDILLSESQERMLLVVEPRKVAAVEAVFGRWGLDACVIGEVFERRTVRLFWKSEILTELDPAVLVDEAPEYHRPFNPWISKTRNLKTIEKQTASMEVSGSFESRITRVLHSPAGMERKWIYEQYDQRVGAKTVRDSSASFGVVRLPYSHRGLGIVLGCRPAVMRMDAEQGGRDAVVYPCLKLASKGFEAVAATDCLNFGNPEKIEIMSEFVASVDGMNAACAALKVPIISGNVSFYNETEGRNITSTPSTGIVGLRKNIADIPTDCWGANEVIFLLEQKLLECNWTDVPGVDLVGRGDLKISAVTQFVKSVFNLVQGGAIKSSRVVGELGLGHSLAKMCMGGVGANLKIISSDSDLWKPTFYQVLVTIDSGVSDDFMARAQKEFTNSQSEVAPSVKIIGQTGGTEIKFGDSSTMAIVKILNLYSSGWEAHFEELA